MIPILALLVGGYFFLILNGWSPYYEFYEITLIDPTTNPGAKKALSFAPISNVALSDEKLKEIPKFAFMVNALEEMAQYSTEPKIIKSGSFVLDSTFTPYRIDSHPVFGTPSLSVYVSEDEFSLIRNWIETNLQESYAFTHNDIHFTIAAGAS